MKKARFLATFLVAFALLLTVWRAVDGSRWYTSGLLMFAGFVGPMIHGWVLDVDPHGRGLPNWVHGANKVQLSIQFDAMSVALVPLLALIAATPGLGVRRRGLLMLAGAALNFVMAGLIAALFPLLVFYKNPFTDVIGTFLGLIALVGAPVIIWFVVSFRELQRWLPSLGTRAKPLK
jgi:hypothetical protein